MAKQVDTNKAATVAEAKAKQPKKPKSFEEGITRLDEVIHALEQENLPLDTLMKLYEEGVGLVQDCNRRLSEAEQTVKIVKISADGTRAHLEEFLDADAEKQ